jgi:hypothetical protein
LPSARYGELTAWKNVGTMGSLAVAADDVIVRWRLAARAEAGDIAVESALELEL